MHRASGERGLGGPSGMRVFDVFSCPSGGRLSGQIAEQLMAALDWRLAMDKDTAVWTDEPHLRMLTAIAAAEDDDNASAAFSRISRLFAIESPALRGRGRDLAAAVRRRPDEVRAILVTLAGRGASMQLRCWPGGAWPARRAAVSRAQRLSNLRGTLPLLSLSKQPDDWPPRRKELQARRR
jgi:hypothetical protein